MDNQEFSRLATEPPSGPDDELMEPKARRVMPVVWVTMLVAALALFAAFSAISALPPIPREQRLLAVPGADAPAATAHPGPSPAHAASDQPAGSTRR